jgi:hypothetical protein
MRARAEREDKIYIEGQAGQMEGSSKFTSACDSLRLRHELMPQALINTLGHNIIPMTFPGRRDLRKSPS